MCGVSDEERATRAVAERDALVRDVHGGAAHIVRGQVAAEGGNNEIPDLLRRRHDVGVFVIEQHELDPQATVYPGNQDVRTFSITVELREWLMLLVFVEKVDDNPPLGLCRALEPDAEL